MSLPGQPLISGISTKGSRRRAEHIMPLRRAKHLALSVPRGYDWRSRNLSSQVPGAGLPPERSKWHPIEDMPA